MGSELRRGDAHGRLRGPRRLVNEGHRDRLVHRRGNVVRRCLGVSPIVMRAALNRKPAVHLSAERAAARSRAPFLAPFAKSPAIAQTLDCKVLILFVASVYSCFRVRPG